jgi:hypothetical protein
LERKMLDPHTVFAVTNNFGLLAWAALLLSLFVTAVRRRVWPVTQFAVPAAWALLYLLLLLQGLPQTQGDFQSIEGVRGLFANDSALTAGWLHYLAFDLFVGTWVARDSVERAISPWLVAPCLVLTLLFGPTGLLLYLLFALIGRRRTAAQAAS